MRDEYAYPILAHWIEGGLYSPEAMRAIGSQTADNLKASIGEQGTDAVFLRTFSALILDCVIDYDNQHPFLEEAEVRQWLDDALAYLARECDLRGYVPSSHPQGLEDDGYRLLRTAVRYFEAYSGIFPCFFGGLLSRLFLSISSAVMSFVRV